jgi:hypothetical protein
MAQDADAGPTREKVAFLGITTQPVDDAMGRQLSILKGTGLLVTHVDPASPAAGKIEKHDVLQTIEGQVLVNSEQLAVLVRTNAPGSTVTLSLVRKASPIRVSVVLAEKELPPIARSPTGRMPDANLFRFLSGTNAPIRFRMRDDAGHATVEAVPGGSSWSRTVTSQSDGMTGTSTMRTGSHTFTLKTNGGKRTLKIAENEGKTVFEGPLDTDADRKQVPARFQDDLKELDGLAAGIAGEVSDAVKGEAQADVR